MLKTFLWQLNQVALSVYGLYMLSVVLKRFNDFIQKFLSRIKLSTLKVLQIIFQGKEEPALIFLKKRKVFVLSFLGSVIISLSLLYLMAYLVTQKKTLSQLTSQNISIDFLSHKDLEELKTKDRKQPEPPKKAKVPPKTPHLKKQNLSTLKKPKLSLPQPQLDTPKDFSLKGDGVSGGSSSYGDSEVTPIVRMEPRYPRKAAISETEGFVILSFDITPLGTVTNISIIQSSPPQIFNTSAIQALQKWKYKPKTVNNKPVSQKGLKVQLDFKLDKRK